MQTLLFKLTGPAKLRSGEVYTQLGREANLIVRASLHTTAIQVLVPAIRTKLRENKSIFRGALFQRIKTEDLTGPVPGVVVGAMGVAYAQEVENGGKPRKVGDAEKRQIIDYASKKNGLSGSDAVRVAHAIIKTIETEGVKAHPFLKPALAAAGPEFLVRSRGRIMRHLFFHYRKMLGGGL
tara:strand:+ start:26136 stop:26678 length:543 start_codon:yes stop_codon:yes gene_type:complete